MPTDRHVLSSSKNTKLILIPGRVISRVVQWKGSPLPPAFMLAV